MPFLNFITHFLGGLPAEITYAKKTIRVTSRCVSKRIDSHTPQAIK